MSNKDFDGFVKSLQPQAAESSIDWAKRREEWLRHLEGLYTTIISFLRDYIQKGEIKTEYHPINLNEEHIGSYQTRKLTLKIGSREIALRPIGTLLLTVA